tara:strand:+ start:4688 stop:6337 length:1650 start_codon:yes stop_codon:yes gene_type:complete
VYAGVGGFVAKAFDAVLAPFAPGTVLSRQRSRLQSTQLLNYDAAQRHRQRRLQQSSSADEDLLTSLPEMRVNSRAMARDDSAAAAMVRVLEDNVIGTGLVPQMMFDTERAKLAGFTSSQAADYGRSVEQLFAEAAPQIDASDNDDFEAMQRTALRNLVVDGEVLAHRIMVKESDQKRVVQTAFEMIDVDRLVDPNDMRPNVRAGVELGDRDNAVAYWITPRHPDENWTMHTQGRMRENLPVRSPRYAGGRQSILHMYRRDRPGQSRGVPFFAPCFGLVEAMNDMLETELQSTRAASKFCAFIKQTVDANDLGFEQDSDGMLHEELGSAEIRYLNKGEDLVPYSPNRPNSSFEPFVVRVLRSICASLGLPYELVLKDFGGMNYSSARVALLEARRGFDVLRQIVARKFCQPIFEATVFDAVVNRKIRVPRGFTNTPSLFLKAYWQPPAAGWVDPVKEVESSRLAVENNLSSPQAEAMRQGSDHEVLLRQRARHEKLRIEIEKEHELPAGTLRGQPAPADTATEPPPEQDEGDENNDQDKEQEAADEADKR